MRVALLAVWLCAALSVCGCGSTQQDYCPPDLVDQGGNPEPWKRTPKFDYSNAPGQSTRPPR
jgi:hypothetical protein